MHIGPYDGYQVLRFLIVGGVASAIQYLAFVFLVRYGRMEDIRATNVAYVFHALVKFPIHRMWTFGIAGHVYNQIGLYFVLEGFNFFLNAAGMKYLQKHTHFNAYVNQLIVMVAMGFWSYIANHWVFT